MDLDSHPPRERVRDRWDPSGFGEEAVVGVVKEEK